MSQQYDMSIKIQEVYEKETYLLEKICSEIGFFLDSDLEDLSFYKKRCFQITGEGCLCGGETEEEFSDRVAYEIWVALGRYVPITIRATYLEELPYTIHVRNKEKYRSILKRHKNIKNQDKNPLEYYCQQCGTPMRKYKYQKQKGLCWLCIQAIN